MFFQQPWIQYCKRTKYWTWNLNRFPTAKKFKNDHHQSFRPPTNIFSRDEPCTILKTSVLSISNMVIIKNILNAWNGNQFLPHHTTQTNQHTEKLYSSFVLSLNRREANLWRIYHICKYLENSKNREDTLILT